MKIWILLFLVSPLQLCSAREPFKPYDKSVPFLVYYTSRYRGICVGTLVARTVVLSAAVCVVDPFSFVHDTRPINVVVGTSYRHPRRGVRVQVTKIIVPKLPTHDFSQRDNIIEKSPCVLLLRRRVPDILAEIPLRALEVDWKGENTLTLQEECLMTGWHFFYQGDKIYPIAKYLLQRNVRVQFVNIVKMHEWCDALSLKLQKALANVGYHGEFEKTGMICIKDPDNTAQPCHGMYGAPLICGGRAVGMLSAPDAQWTNCTGYSNIVHLFDGFFMRDFMACVSKLFKPDLQVDWSRMKKAIYDEAADVYDYLPAMYDKVLARPDSASTSGEYEL